MSNIPKDWIITFNLQAQYKRFDFVSSVVMELEQNSIKVKLPALQHTLPITPDSFNQLIWKFGFI